ncbi:MAG: hypothetical protein KAI69_06620, partial [Deltaproteobacteria bacterium]|nr:hypothetical protein [Deltaproteobacteria bacterium]
TLHEFIQVAGVYSRGRASPEKFYKKDFVVDIVDFKRFTTTNNKDFFTQKRHNIVPFLRKREALDTSI